MSVPSARRTVALLAVCQTALLTNGVLLAVVNSLAGYALGAVPPARHHAGGDVRPRRGRVHHPGLVLHEAPRPPRRLRAGRRDRRRRRRRRHARHRRPQLRAAARRDVRDGRVQRVRPVLPLRRRGRGPAGLEEPGDLAHDGGRRAGRLHRARPRQVHARPRGAAVRRVLRRAVAPRPRVALPRDAASGSPRSRRRSAVVGAGRSASSCASRPSRWRSWRRRSATGS